MGNGFEVLTGLTIRSALIGNEKETLILTTDSGKKYEFNAVGDCCSNSWFEHMNGVESLIGHAILNVITREIPEDKQTASSHELNDDVISYYGWTIETVAGRFDIEMRNASNGYYGGYIEQGYEAKEVYPGFKPLEDF